MRRYFWRFAVVSLLGVATALCAGALMFISGYLISKAALRPENILMIYVPIVLVRTFGIGKAVVHYFERLVSHDTVLRILSNMRIRLYRTLEPHALTVQSRFRTGDILGMLAEDIEHLQNVYLSVVLPSVVALAMAVICIVALGAFDVSFAWLIAVYMFILVFILPVGSLLYTKVKQRQLKRGRNRLYQTLTDAVLGMSDWIISGRGKQFARQYEGDEKRVRTIEGALNRWARWRALLLQIVGGVIVVSTVYWAAGQAADGHIAQPFIAAFILVVFPLLDVFFAVSESVEKWPQYQDSLARLNRLSETLKRESINMPSVQSETVPVDWECVHIQLDDVRFRYDRGGPWIVDGTSLYVPYGKKIAVIGRSGAGKSTLLKLMQGAVAPQHGRVTINGIDATSLGDDVSRVISVLNQKPHLFDTTIENNIRLGKPDAAAEEVRHAAELARIHHLIETLPQGYDTAVLEAGRRFSGGERQRIALARILVQDAPVVLLDEPTIGLDPHTERELLATIFETLRDKTLVWITHHLIAAEHMDEIVFFENGKIKMKGPHGELMTHSPRYRQLYALDRATFV